MSWADQKKVAFRIAQKIPADGQLIVTSFTNKQPMHGWTPRHAMREIWQNFRDGLRTRFGDNIKLQSVGHNIFQATVADRCVGILDGSGPDRLVLTQAECLLTAEHLQLASWKKGKSIGGHGEGFKVGINLLLRHNYRVTYQLPFYEWRFELREFYSENFRNMCVLQLPSAERDEMTIIIEGPGAAALFDPMIDLELTSGLVKICSGTDGDILSPENENGKGKVYCRGLFVAVDDDLVKLGLVVNLNTQVARDRHIIPSNTWSLIQQILDEVCEKFRQDPRLHIAQAAVFNHLIQVCALHQPTDHSLMRALAHIKPPVTKFVALDNHVDEANVVFVAAAQGNLENLLRKLGRYVVPSAGALADALDIEQLRISFVEQQPDSQPVGGEQTAIAKALNNFIQAIVMSFNFKLALRIKDLPLGMQEFSPEYINGNVVVDRNLLTKGRVLVVAQTIVYRIQRHVSGSNLDNTFAAITVDFFRDPFAFQPKRYDIIEQPDAAHFASSSSDASPSTSSSLSSLSSSSLSTPAEPINTKPAKKSKPQPEIITTVPRPINGLNPDDRVRQCGFRGVPSMFRAPSTDGDYKEDAEPCARLYNGSLTPHFFNEKCIVYFDQQIYDSIMAEDVSSLLTRIENQAPACLHAIDVLKQRVGVRLVIPPEDLPIMLVAVRDNLLGFTQAGGIYINVIPLLDVSSFNDQSSSIFITLLHEICHRVHTPHNSFFADELARLVYRCRDCLD